MTVAKVCNKIALKMVGENDTEDDHNKRLKILQYAFKYVQPSKHVEYAFCVWAGSRYESPVDTIDKYCKQRNGDINQSSPYSMVDPDYWKIPETHGVFVFREQFFVLIAELTECSIFSRAPQILTNIYRGTCSFENFCKLLTNEYTDSLSGAEKAALFNNIYKDYPAAMPYYWCSTIVDMALNYSSTLPNQKLTINVEEVFVHGFHEILGFTEEDRRSFLHLSEDEYKRSKKIGEKEYIQKMNMEYYAHLKSTEENRIRLLECKQRRENKHKSKRRKSE